MLWHWIPWGTGYPGHWIPWALAALGTGYPGHWTWALEILGTGGLCITGSGGSTLARQGGVGLLLVQVVEDVVEDEVVAVLVLRQVLHQLGPVPPHRLHRLEDVHLAVLDDLLDAGVGRAVH